jgi:Flp pilus assembly protein TadG
MTIGPMMFTRSALRDDRGSVAVLFGFLLLVMMMAAGLAIDHTRLANASANLKRAADAAALAAVAKPAMLQNASEQAQITHSASLAETYFKSNPLAAGVTLEKMKADVALVQGQWTAKLSYNASMPMMFGRLFGSPKTKIMDTSSAASSAAKYIDVYVLVDSSASMGIGAGPADQAIMRAEPTMNCTFACHARGTVATAHAAGARLRFDVIKDAVADLVATASGLNENTHVRIGLYSFATNFKTEIDITSDLGAVGTAANAMDLSTYNGGTNVFEALTRVQAKVEAAGDGSSAASPLTFVILATDGTGNASDNTDPASPDAGNWIHSPLFVPSNPHGTPDPTQPNMHLTGLDPDWCQPIKDLGANMMTLETEYVISPLEASELRFDYIQNTLAPSLKTNMAACASKPSFNISANSPAEILTAMDTLFQAALAGGPRLMN